MAYKAPELLLVGAAQNVVLLQSVDDPKGSACGIEELNPENYDFDPGW